MRRPIVVHNYMSVPRAAVEEGYAAMELPEIAERLGLSRQRVGRIYRSAMSKLVAQPEAMQRLRDLAKERRRLADQRPTWMEVDL